MKIVKKIISTLLILIVLSGCTDVTPQSTEYIPTANPTPAKDNTDTTAFLAPTPTPVPKISSDFEDAPSILQIKDETGKDVSQILLQDTLQYNIPMNEYFAVALQEDAQKHYRWLLASDDGKFQYVQETHINGYRIFIFDILELGEASVLFELTQNSTSVVETLSYQLVFN